MRTILLPAYRAKYARYACTFHFSWQRNSKIKMSLTWILFYLFFLLSVSVSLSLYIYMYIHIYVYIYIYIYIGGWGCESDQDIVFVSFVRASARSCVWSRDDVATVAGLRKLAECDGVAVRRSVPFPWPCVKSR